VRLNIRRVRRIHIGNPANAVGWTPASQYVVGLDQVRD